LAQSYGAHATLFADAQLPAPSHCNPDCAFDMQVVAPHTVPACACWTQLAVPLFVPSQIGCAPHVVPLFVHVPLGSGVVAAVPPQVPSGPLPFLAFVHDWQTPLHAWSQQTPSWLQLPVEHWSAAVHCVPFASFGAHIVPPRQ